MQINQAGGFDHGKNIDAAAARKVIEEFNEVAGQVEKFDNVDKVDLNSSKGVVEFKEAKLPKEEGKVFSGKIKFDPETREKKEMFITVNHEKYGGTGINYSFHQDDKTASYWRDDMYQEAPLSRYIQTVTVDKKSNQILSYEAWEERDDYNIFPGPGSDY